MTCAGAGATCFTICGVAAPAVATNSLLGHTHSITELKSAIALNDVTGASYAIFYDTKTRVSLSAPFHLMMRTVHRTPVFTTENGCIIKWDAFLREKDIDYTSFTIHDPHLMIPCFLS